MKRYYLLVFSLSLALLFFVYGSFADRESMKWSAVGLTLLVFAVMRLSNTDLQFLSTQNQHIRRATATGYAFQFLLLLLGLIFLWNIFIHPIANPDFAVFGSLFLSVLVMRIYSFQLIIDYIGKTI